MAKLRCKKSGLLGAKHSQAAAQWHYMYHAVFFLCLFFCETFRLTFALAALVLAFFDCRRMFQAKVEVEVLLCEAFQVWEDMISAAACFAALVLRWRE